MAGWLIEQLEDRRHKVFYPNLPAGIELARRTNGKKPGFCT